MEEIGFLFLFLCTAAVCWFNLIVVICLVVQTSFSWCSCLDWLMECCEVTSPAKNTTIWVKTITTEGLRAIWPFSYAPWNLGLTPFLLFLGFRKKGDFRVDLGGFWGVWISYSGTWLRITKLQAWKRSPACTSVITQQEFGLTWRQLAVPGIWSCILLVCWIISFSHEPWKLARSSLDNDKDDKPVNDRQIVRHTVAPSKHCYLVSAHPSVCHFLPHKQTHLLACPRGKNTELI